MNNNRTEIAPDAVEKAISGDRKALEELLTGIQDPVFHLSLRMLGSIPDAEDATQEILLKVMTHLSSFRGESAFTTWVFRIAVNHLKDYKKPMFANHPLSFDYYGADIDSGKKEIPALSRTDHTSEQELKLSCTMSCFNARSGAATFILGTMVRSTAGLPVTF
ncbi:MAG: RNA polymerase sigma factor [Eisenbergiella sp.]